MLFSSLESTQSLPDAKKAMAYQIFVDTLSSKDDRFRPLSAFLAKPSTNSAQISVVRFLPNAKPQRTSLKEADLESQLLKNQDRELYIVEDISPNVLKLLGGYCNVDAQFFLEYLDTVQRTPANPPESRDTGCGTITLPWYRLGDVENHLPSLQSTREHSQHVHIRFIGPREYHASPTGGESKTNVLNMRLDETKNPTNIYRIGGAHNPIQKDQVLWPAVMTRHSAAVWFDAGVEWKKGIVLLDPPFIYVQENLVSQISKYRPFNSYTIPKPNSILEVDTRETYMQSFIHYLEIAWATSNQSASPVNIVRDLYRIIASEWIAVNAYLERDLNTIEWQLEQKNLGINALDSYLNQLLIMRRRIRKYESLVTRHAKGDMPSSWLDPQDPSSVAASAAIRADFEQVQDLTLRNNQRISQAVALITSLISVIEGKRSTSLNNRLTFLTVLATVILPFNACAGILGIQTSYGPGQDNFWVLWCSALGLGVVILVCYLAFAREGGSGR